MRSPDHWNNITNYETRSSEFYEKFILPNKQLDSISGIDSESTNSEIISSLLRNNEGICIGESHKSISSKKFLIPNMHVLKQENCAYNSGKLPPILKPTPHPSQAIHKTHKLSSILKLKSIKPGFSRDT